MIAGAVILNGRLAGVDWVDRMNAQRFGGHKYRVVKSPLHGNVVGKYDLKKNIRALAGVTAMKTELLVKMKEMKEKIDRLAAEEASLAGTVEKLVNAAMYGKATQNIHRTLQVAFKIPPNSGVPVLTKSRK